MKSCRFLLAMLIWILPSWACTIVNLTYEAEDPAKSTIAHIVSNIGDISRIMSPSLMIPCLGYLVQTARMTPTDMTKLRSNYLLRSYILLITLDTIFNIYLCATTTAQNAVNQILLSVLEIVVTTISNIIMTSNLVMVSMYSGAFDARICGEIRTTSGTTNELLNTANAMLSHYRNLKKGLGPLLLVVFTFGTIYITALLYQLTKLQENPDEWVVIFNLVSKLLSKLVQLMIISLACQHCFTQLKDTKQVIR